MTVPNEHLIKGFLFLKHFVRRSTLTALFPMLLWWLSRPGWSTYSLVIQFAVLECFSWIYHQGKKETYPLNYMILCPFRKSLLTLWHSNRAFVSTSRYSQRIMNSRTDTQAMANSLLSKSIKMEIKRNWNYPLGELNCCV